MAGFAAEPQHATPRSSGSSNKGSSSSGTASPRSAPASSESGGRARPNGSGEAHTRATAPRAESGSTNPNTNREVPTWARRRGDRPTTGTAVTRTTPPFRGGGLNNGYYYDPFFGYGYGGYSGSYFSPYYVPFGFGMAYGLSPFGFDPYGYYDPMLGGYDPYGVGGYSGYDPYAAGGYSGYGSYSNGIYNSDAQGALKLKVKPRSAKVYVDGYFVGTVDQFDGVFQKLSLNGGSHKVEIRAEGYETAQFDVLITPKQTLTFEGDLKKLQ
jgi:hypothetical protein